MNPKILPASEAKARLFNCICDIERMVLSSDEYIGKSEFGAFTDCSHIVATKLNHCEEEDEEEDIAYLRKLVLEWLENLRKNWVVK